jgi:hypothetical protein
LYKKRNFQTYGNINKRFAVISKFIELKRVENKDSYLLVIDPADIHIGKLCSSFESGESYNNQIALNVF